MHSELRLGFRNVLALAQQYQAVAWALRSAEFARAVGLGECTVMFVW
jgi:hypothetical protein